jgi:hypothetical protein
MGKKLKITEDQLKRLVGNKTRIQEQNEGYMDEEIDGPSKEEYFAKHGDDNVFGWTGSSNKTYQDLPDGDYDDETYDDFDTLHSAHPDFHKHYSGNMGPDHARKMFGTYKNHRGPLHIKRRRPMDEMGMEEDGMMNESIKQYKTEFDRFLKKPKK